MNNTKFFIVAAAALIIGFFFLINADYARNAAGTDIQNVMSGVCFVTFIGVMWLGTRKRK